MNRDFKGVWIPKEIWLDERLTALDKVILAEIDSLDNEEHCRAGNNYLSKFCQCSETKVSTTISKLINMGYLEILSFDGRNRTIKSRLFKNENEPLKKLKADLKKVNAIKINNNINNNNIPSVSSLKNSETSPTGEEFLNSNKNHIPIIESGNCSELNNSFEENNNVDSFQVGSKATKEKISNLKLQEDIETKFEWFYKEYPRKVSKAKTRDWFVKNKPCDELMGNIAYGLKKYKEDNEKTDKQYIKHPITWLNQRIWEDYL